MQHGRVNVTRVLAQARDGSDRAANELADRFYPTVRKLVHRELDAGLRRSRPWLATLFSTGDVVHDVFLRVLRGVSTFEGDERDFERYIAQAVVNRLVDAVRHYEAARRDQRRLEHDVEQAPFSERASPYAIAARNEEFDAVESALRTLCSRDQALLVLRQRRGLRYREIATELGLPSEDAARKATQTAEARLLLAMKMRGFG